MMANTTREGLMAEFDSVHPGYKFASHKGYPTPEHCRLLKELGAAPIPRRSFARVRQVLGLDPIQDELFAEPIEEQSRASHGSVCTPPAERSVDGAFDPVQYPTQLEIC